MEALISLLPVFKSPEMIKLQSLQLDIPHDEQRKVGEFLPGFSLCFQGDFAGRVFVAIKSDNVEIIHIHNPGDIRNNTSQGLCFSVEADDQGRLEFPDDQFQVVPSHLDGSYLGADDLSGGRTASFEITVHQGIEVDGSTTKGPQIGKTEKFRMILHPGVPVGIRLLPPHDDGVPIAVINGRADRGLNMALSDDWGNRTRPLPGEVLQISDGAGFTATVDAASGVASLADLTITGGRSPVTITSAKQGRGTAPRLHRKFFLLVQMVPAESGAAQLIQGPQLAQREISFSVSQSGAAIAANARRPVGEGDVIIKPFTDVDGRGREMQVNLHTLHTPSPSFLSTRLSFLPLHRLPLTSPSLLLLPPALPHRRGQQAVPR